MASENVNTYFDLASCSVSQCNHAFIAELLYLPAWEGAAHSTAVMWQLPVIAKSEEHDEDIQVIGVITL
jgi:hypothetical protein